MTQTSAKKIAIIGNAGSGKTTLAFALHNALKLPLYHLDQYYWLPDWQRIGLEKFTALHTELCNKESWIIEGSYHKLLSERAKRADVIIFLDRPRSLCILRVLKRALLNWGSTVPGDPAGCKQELFTYRFFEFLRWVWNFNTRNEALIMHILNNFKDTKKVYILKSSQEITEFIANSKNL